MLGVTIGATRKTYGLFESIGESFFYLWSMVRETFTFFGSLFRGQVQSTDVAGAVGSIVYISEAVRYGMETTLRILIVLSMSLVIFNLLPIPALDGGRLLFIAIELVRGRPVDPRKEGMVHFVGLVVLAAADGVPGVQRYCKSCAKLGGGRAACRGTSHAAYPPAAVRIGGGAHRQRPVHDEYGHARYGGDHRPDPGA